MEKKLEIIESNSEVSKDKLWLKPIKEGMSLLHYGSNGWEHILGKSSSTDTPIPTPTPTLKDIPDSEFKNLNGKDTLHILELLKESISKASSEEYILYINSNLDTLHDFNFKRVKKYIQNNLTGKKTYKYGSSTIDASTLTPVLKKGDLLRVYKQNPDFYVRLKVDFQLDMVQAFLSMLEVCGFLDYYVETDRNSKHHFETYVLENNEVIKKNLLLSDMVEIIDKSREKYADINDGFRYVINTYETYIDDNISLVEYYKLRSPNLIVSEHNSRIYLLGKDNKINAYDVINEHGCTLKDIYSILKIHKNNEDVCKYLSDNNERVLELHDLSREEYTYKHINDIVIYRDEVVGNITYHYKDSNVNENDIILSGTNSNESFLILDKNIDADDLIKFQELVNNLLYYNNNYKEYIQEYYAPYETYKFDSLRDKSSFIAIKEKAEKAKTGLLSFLDDFKNKIVPYLDFEGGIATICQVG